MFNSPAELQVLSRFKVTGIPRKAPQVVSVRWQHPPTDWVKVNTDGSYSYDTDKSGAGGCSEILVVFLSAALPFLQAMS